MIHPTSLGPLGVDVGSASIEITKDGLVQVRTGMTEYGEGLYTGFVVIVVRILGLNTKIRIEMADTGLALDSGPKGPPRGTVNGRYGRVPGWNPQTSYGSTIAYWSRLTGKEPGLWRTSN